ncbi:hypothetical protein HY572_04775 [Candidatus Micrarchaeota archaeon]|nr:hypothetical protein [Candidatus Micrarchaeota archaeon]
MPEFHHFVMVPSKRPDAMKRFLHAYKEHIAQTGTPQNRVQFIVVNASQRHGYGQLKKELREFLQENPEFQGQVHFIQNQWKDEFMRELKKEGVPSSLRRFFKYANYSQLRNMGYLASLRLARELRVNPRNVLLHQIDDDVLPHYSTQDDPRSMQPLHPEISVFGTAEAMFSNPRVGAVLGNYVGQKDIQIPRALRLALQDAQRSRHYNPLDLHDILKDPRRALEFYRGLQGATTTETPETWTRPPTVEDFTRTFTRPRFDGRPGGAMVFRLSHYGYVPPTRFRGEDHLHARKLFAEDPAALHYAPKRLLYHDRYPQRDLLGESQSDFFSQMIATFSHPSVLPDEQTLRKHIRQFAEINYAELSEAPWKELQEAHHELTQQIAQIQEEGDDQEKLPVLRQVQTEQKKVIDKLNQLKTYYEEIYEENHSGNPQSKTSREVRNAVLEFNANAKKLEEHQQRIVRAALKIPMPKNIPKPGKKAKNRRRRPNKNHFMKPRFP